MIKRTKAIFIAAPLLLASGYFALVWHSLQNNIDQPILAIVTDTIPGIPRSIAKAYLYASDYDPNADTTYGMPALNFIVAGYGSGDSWNNQEIIELSRKFIAKGADVNKTWQGFTPLQAAVLANEPVLVEHLLQYGADPSARFRHPGKPEDNMTTYEFAEYLTIRKQQDTSKILKTLAKRHQQNLLRK